MGRALETEHTTSRPTYNTTYTFSKKNSTGSNELVIVNRTLSMQMVLYK